MGHYSDHAEADRSRAAKEAADLRAQALAKLPPEKRAAIEKIDAMFEANWAAHAGIQQTIEQFFPHIQDDEDRILLLLALSEPKVRELFKDQKHVPVKRKKGPEGLDYTDRSMDLG